MTIRTSHLRLALAALGLAVLYNIWVFGRPSSSANSGISRPQAPLLASNDVPGVATGVAIDPASVPAPPAVDLTSPLSLRRDPFLFGDERRDGPTPETQRARLADPVVKTILFSPTRRTAIVNGAVVGIGDTVGGFTVVAIERDAVVLTAPDGEQRRVSLARPGTPGASR